MKRSIFTLLLATLFFGASQANPVDVATAKSLGVKFMKANTAVKADAAELTYTAYAENGQAEILRKCNLRKFETAWFCRALAVAMTLWDGEH